MSDEGEILQGPANWFTIRCPPQLCCEQTEALLEFREKPTPPALSSQQAGEQDVAYPAETNRWTMTLYAAWMDPNDPQGSEDTFGVHTLFPEVVRCRTESPLQIPGHHRTWSGVSRMPSAGHWWRRLLRRSGDYQWQLWIAEHEQILIVASLQSAAGEVLTDSDRSLCLQTLNSITFAEVPAWPPELFRREVIRLARTHFPLLETSSSGSFSIRISDSEISLSNFYRSYLMSPQQFRQIVLPGLTTVVRMSEWSAEQLMPPLENVRRQIMPMLYPQSESDGPMNEFVQLEWIGGLTVMFVLDEDETYRFIHRQMLTDWNLSPEELRDLAMSNLDRFAGEHPLEVRVIGEEHNPGMLVPTEPDAYNASRLLGCQLHARLREILGPEVVVGVPNRDFFVAVSLRHPQLVQQVRDQVIRDHRTIHHPLTSRLLVISADGVSEYCEDTSDPAH